MSLVKYFPFIPEDNFQILLWYLMHNILLMKSEKNNGTYKIYYVCLANTNKNCNQNPYGSM